MFRKQQRLLRWPTRAINAVSWVILVTFFASVINPTIVIAKEVSKREALMKAPERTELETFGDTLIALEEVIDRANRRITGKHEFEWQEIAHRGGHAPAPERAATRAEIKALEDEIDAAAPKLESLQGAIKSYFAQTGQHLKDKNLPVEIVARHEAQVADYEAKYGKLKDLLKNIHVAHDQAAFAAAVAETDAFLKANSSKPARAPFDPEQLAFGPPKARARKPAQDAAALNKALGITTKGTTASTKTDAKAAPTPADLAATEDAQLTDAIRAKAEELGKQPVAIYNFVHDNVEFMPTYGSIQGADQTLKTMRGNAFDQSSLLIALLRASNIPARYVYGTVEIPADKVMNWVGGVEVPEAALDLLGQGGIPNEGIAVGGVIKTVRMEHVWVEAFVDFVPSRGAKHREGDTWVPLDASFKQYDYTDGMDLAEKVAFDKEAFRQGVLQGATINEAEGSVSGINTAFADEQFVQLLKRFESHVANTSSDASVEDVVGTKRIRASAKSNLGGSVPFDVLSERQVWTSVPEPLRWKFRYAVNGEVALLRSLPNLAGSTLSLSFKPATTQDAETLNSYLPSSLDGPEDLPSSLPASLLKLVGEFAVEGSVVATTKPAYLGSELSTVSSLFQPGSGWHGTSNIVTVGDYQAISLDSAGVSRNELMGLAQSLRDTAAKVEASEHETLSKHEIVGSILQGLSTSFFSQTHSNYDLAARAGGLVTYRLPSYGSVSTESRVTSFLGVPKRVAPGSLRMDMDRVAQIVTSKQFDQAQTRTFVQQLGSMLSGRENTCFEEVIAPDGTHEAVSASKLLSLAAAVGQRVFRIDASNVNAALSATSLPVAVEREIVDAVLAGKVVETHEAEITFAGQTTIGYVVLDPQTGAGAYKIADGSDGGRIFLASGGDSCQKSGETCGGDGDHSPGWLDVLGIVLGLIALGEGAIALTAAVAGIALTFVLLYKALADLSEALMEAGCPFPVLAVLAVIVIAVTALGFALGAAGGIIVAAVVSIIVSAIATTVAQWLKKTGFCKLRERPVEG